MKIETILGRVVVTENGCWQYRRCGNAVMTYAKIDGIDEQLGHRSVYTALVGPS